MANYTFKDASGSTQTAASDAVGGVNYQYIKLIDGVAGNNTNVAGITAGGALKTDASATTQPVSMASVPSHAVTIASGGVASGAIASGAVASGAVASGAFASGSIAAGAVAAGASSFVKLEDAANADLDAGVPAMAVRKATPANLSGTDGDYEFLQVSAGRLWTSATIDAALPAGTNNIGDVDVLTVPADPFGANADAASATGSISAKLRFIAATGIPITGTVTVGSHAVTNAGTFAVQESGTQVQVDDAAFTPATSKIVMAGAEFDDTSPDSVDEGDGGAIRMSANRNLYVRIRDNAGNERGLNIDANGALAATVTGSIAHDSVDSGNPVKVGGRARSSEITAVASDDRSDFITDLVGKLIVLPYANPENFVSGTTSAITDTTSTSLIAAPAAGLRNYITSILVTNSHATVSTFVTIRDGSGGTVLWQGYALAAGGGFAVHFPTPLRQPTTATALHVKNETTGSNTIANAAGYKGA